MESNIYVCVCVSVRSNSFRCNLFTWQGVHCVPPGNVLFAHVLHTVHPALTPGKICHTLSLLVRKKDKPRISFFFFNQATIV